MKSNSWDDHYTVRARKEKWLARSVYKLREIDRKFKVIRKGDRVLDLGCYPGSWSQYAVSKAGKKGRVTGIDLKEASAFKAPNFKSIEADILSLEVEGLAAKVGGVHLVLSDMAPPTTGIRDRDAARSLVLSEKAFEIAYALLENGGGFVCKIFEGGDVDTYKTQISPYFKKIRLFRPKATRKKSREVYVVGTGFISNQGK